MGRGAHYTEAELSVIDVEHRSGRVARCPHDAKPLVMTSWNGKLRMVYFLCRACSRIGAIGYESDDPSLPGRIAMHSTPSSRPPGR